MNKYFVLLTDIGIAKLANATSLNQPLKISHMAVGDSNGVMTPPNIKQTSLVNECYRAQLNSLSRDETNHNQIIAEMVIPENIGGWYIREAGLLDEHGDLIAVANTPESYKPQLQEGSGRSQIIRMVLVISNTTSVELKIDSSVVLASRQYVEQLIKQHANSDNHPTATTSKKGMVILSNAVDSKSETTAATSASIQTAIAKSRQYSEQLIKQHANSDNHPMATTSKKGMVILSNATTSDSGTTAATSKAVKAVADAIKGITFPVTSVNQKTGKVTLTADDVNALAVTDAPKLTVLYPGGSKNNPGYLATNTRIEVDNPFPNCETIVTLEVFYNGIWGEPGHVLGGSTYGFGANAIPVYEQNKIIIQSARGSVISASYGSGNPFNLSASLNVSISVPFRIRVRKIV